MNRLAAEQSPYLTQHGENPVDWYPWGPEAFERAGREDRPIFLSIGYSTCHWCHVMARESFQDRAVAEALNGSFISIKVDREERPDVDAVYMAACMAMTGSGGWPLTVLLTPDQRPFWAGTYLPKGQLLGLLERAAMLWREDRAGLLAAGEQLTVHLRSQEESGPGVPSRALVAGAMEGYEQLFDPIWGGFGQAPKFPTPHDLLFLMEYGRKTGDRRADEMAERTLECMYRGGLFDHAGGGFARYSTDRQWLVPHFEKMLYDNALLALAYTEGYRRAGRPLWREVACRTLDFILRELKDPLGGFYCGLDADSGGEEGKYYLLTARELRELLGPEGGALFNSWYGVTEEGNFEGKNVLNLIGRADLDREPEGVAELRRRVYDYRRERAVLHRDDKVLTAWNGLAIAALARGGLALARPEYLAAAERAAAFVEEHLTGERGRLLARWRVGHAAHPGKLEDYAFLAWGLLELYGAGLRTEYLTWAATLAGVVLEAFSDQEVGGFYPYAADGEQLITRTKEAYDGAMPSGNAVMGLVLSRLSRLTGEERWRRAAEGQLAWLAGAAEGRQPGHGFAMLAMVEALWPTTELICAAREYPDGLTAFLREVYRPELSVMVKTPGSARALAELAPYTADYPIPERGARFYLCRNGACAQPVESLEQVKELLGS